MLNKLFVAALVVVLGFSAGRAEAGPFDFLKRVGDSIAHAHDRQVARQKNAKRNRNRSKTTIDQPDQQGQTSASPTPANAQPPAQTPPPNQTPIRAAAGVSENTGRDIPYGIPVPGKDGFVTSPWSPNQGYVDVRGFPSGTEVKDPYTGKVFRTP